MQQLFKTIGHQASREQAVPQHAGAKAHIQEQPLAARGEKGGDVGSVPQPDRRLRQPPFMLHAPGR